MTAEALIITELTGQQREVRLFDRALPYQKLAAPRAQHYVQRWYPGSRVATVQVLGPRVGDWTLEGMWKTRFTAAAKSAELVGFLDIDSVGGRITAEDLVEVFTRLCSAGQTIEVRWGPEIRRGIMSAFDPSYTRVEDIEWRCEFVWTQDGARPAGRATFAVDTTADMTRALDALDLVAAERPASVLPSVGGEIDAKVSAVRQAGAAFTEALAKVQAETNAAVADVQDVQALGERLAQAAEALRTGVISDLPYYNLLPVDDVGAALEVEVWRRGTGAASRDVAVQSQKSSSAVAERTSFGALAVVTATANTTLRNLALQYYGEPDAWTVIADENGFTGSIVPEGTRVVIPRRPGQVTKESTR